MNTKDLYKKIRKTWDRKPQTKPHSTKGYVRSISKQELAEAIEELESLWCTCTNRDSDNIIFADDNQCTTCEIQKHHYHCAVCGGLVQIG